MNKVLLIMLCVFIVIASIHFITLKIHKLPKINKQKHSRRWWYFYGGHFLLYGVFLNIQNRFDIIGAGFIILSICGLFANFKGKIRLSWD